MSLAVKLALAPLLLAQAVQTRRRVPVLPEAAGARSGELGGAGAGDTVLRVLIVGDSSAAGVGVDHQDRALAGWLTRALAAALPLRVRWTLIAQSGVTSAQALTLVRQAQPAAHDVAVVVTGVNDVVAQVAVRRAVQARAALADWLRAHAQVRHVAYAALPPMHRFPALPQPLRWVVGADAQRHERALAAWVAQRAHAQGDVSHVPIAIGLGPEHMAHDGFHPGEPVYRACGEAIAAHLASVAIPPDRSGPGGGGPR